MLALRLMLRNWRSGEVKIFAGSLALAVAVVTAVAVFANRMELSLERQSNYLLAADRAVSSRFEIPEPWLRLPEQFRLQQSHMQAFDSMVFAGDEMHLASIKAVAPLYPLRGQLEVSDHAFASSEQVAATDQIPAVGEVWADSRLLALLNLQLGQELVVGELPLTVTKVVIREPDQSVGVSMVGPRLLMNIADVPATEVIRPGSRVDYRWLLAGEEQDIKAFEQALEPLLGEHYRLLNVRDAQRSINAALEKGSNFLLLAGMIAVLMASVSIAIAAQQFAERHVDQVALIKSLGAGAWRIRGLYLAQLLLLTLFASLLGVTLGELIQRVIAVSLEGLFNLELLAADTGVYFTGVATGLLCVLCFALPPLWYLPTVSPLKVLRRELTVTAVQSWLRGAVALLAVVLLIFVYSGSAMLTAAVVAGLLVLLCACAGLSLLLLHTGRRLGMRAGSVWRLALANLDRHKSQAVVQIVVFSCAFMLLMVPFSLRTSLIDEWRMQLPTKAPNHFMLNISTYEREAVERFLGQQSLQTETFYPMVMGRITAVNGTEISEQQRQQSNAFRREVNLSWTEQLAADNSLLQGQWWDSWQGASDLPGVSVEQEVAAEMQLALGDEVTFSLGGIVLTAEVASIRSLQWESMRPNFYFLFEPGALSEFTPNYMTSLYIPPEQKLLLNHLLREFPTIVVIEADRIIDNLRKIIDQISRIIELVMWLILVAGFFVLAAAVHASIHYRLQEAGLLRALGSSRKLLLGSLLIEFSALGLIAGLLAVLGGESLLVALQVFVFEQAVTLHVHLWLAVPLIALTVIAAVGVFACRRVVSVPPALVLREL